MPKKVKKHALFPTAYDEISLVDDGAAGSAHVLIMKRASVVKGRNSKNPCSTESNSTGAKDGKSKRSQNWKEEKHKRKKGGKFAETSAESKAKNGKGGTTKAKLDDKCRGNKTKGAQRKPVSQITGDPEQQKKIRERRKRRKQRYVNEGRPVTKSSLSSWDSNAHIRAILERK